MIASLSPALFAKFKRASFAGHVGGVVALYCFGKGTALQLLCMARAESEVPSNLTEKYRLAGKQCCHTPITT